MIGFRSKDLWLSGGNEVRLEDWVPKCRLRSVTVAELPKLDHYQNVIGRFQMTGQKEPPTK